MSNFSISTGGSLSAMTPQTVSELISSIEFWFQAIAVAHDLEDVFEYGAGLPDLSEGEIDKLIADIFSGQPVV